MRTWLLSILLLLASYQPGRAQQLQHSRETSAQREQNARDVLALLYSLTWVSESDGYNAGPGVEMIVRLGGGNYRQRPAWCGFTQAYTNLQLRLPIPANGMQGAARAWFPLTGPDAERTRFRRGRLGSEDVVAVGQRAGFDYGSGIHHVAAVVELGRSVRAGRAPRTIKTLAGNEGNGRRAGLHLTQYPMSSIDALADWNYHLLKNR